MTEKFKFHWGHGIIVALLVFMLFILGMVFFFPIGKQGAEMISDNYYEDELQFQKVIDAKNNADRLTEKPEIAVAQNGIKISFPKDFNNSNSQYHFYLYRTDDRNLDVKKDFSLDTHNEFQIPASLLRKGSYTLKLMWTQQKENYQRDFVIEWK